MKIIYQGREVGLPKEIKNVAEMFGESIRVSPKHIIACKLNNTVKSLDYQMKEGDTVELIDLTDNDGIRVYTRGILYVPEKASFKYLLSLPEGESIGKAINDASKSVQECIASDIILILPDIIPAIIFNIIKIVFEIIEVNAALFFNAFLLCLIIFILINLSFQNIIIKYI